MPEKSPEEICVLFRKYMREGDIDALLALYDPEVAFPNQSAAVRKGPSELKEELAPFCSCQG
jgi:hypothetical protein